MKGSKINAAEEEKEKVQVVEDSMRMRNGVRQVRMDE